MHRTRGRVGPTCGSIVSSFSLHFQEAVIKLNILNKNMIYEYNNTNSIIGQALHLVLLKPNTIWSKEDRFVDKQKGETK